MMSNVININPSTSVMHHLADDKIEGMSISNANKNKLYLGTPCEFSNGKFCDVYLDNEFHEYKTEDLKQLLISWLAIIEPSVLVMK